MASYRSSHLISLPAPRSLIAAILLLFALMIPACIREQALPPEAMQALEDHLATLPGAAARFEILRTWQGLEPRGDLPPRTAAPEIWCAEVDINLETESEEPQQPFIWIITRYDVDSPWIAAMLLTMSASWPYEACDQTRIW